MLVLLAVTLWAPTNVFGQQGPQRNPPDGIAYHPERAFQVQARIQPAVFTLGMLKPGVSFEEVDHVIPLTYYSCSYTAGEGWANCFVLGEFGDSSELGRLSGTHTQSLSFSVSRRTGIIRSIELVPFPKDSAAPIQKTLSILKKAWGDPSSHDPCYRWNAAASDQYASLCRRDAAWSVTVWYGNRLDDVVRDIGAGDPGTPVFGGFTSTSNWTWFPIWHPLRLPRLGPAVPIQQVLNALGVRETALSCSPSDDSPHRRDCKVRYARVDLAGMRGSVELKLDGNDYVTSVTVLSARMTDKAAAISLANRIATRLSQRWGKPHTGQSEGRWEWDQPPFSAAVTWIVEDIWSDTAYYHAMVTVSTMGVARNVPGSF